MADSFKKKNPCTSSFALVRKYGFCRSVENSPDLKTHR